MGDIVSYEIHIIDETGGAGATGAPLLPAPTTGGGTRSAPTGGASLALPGGESVPLIDLSAIAPTIDGTQMEQFKKFRSIAVASASALAQTYITTEINRVALQTGHSTLQRQIQYKYSLGRRLMGVSAGIAGSIATGNPLGAIAGVTALISRSIQLSINETNLDIQHDVEEVGIRQANIRAGAGGNRFDRQ